jgi:hypothetical protein
MSAAKLVADSDLTMGRIFDGISNNRILRFCINPVLRIENTPGTFQQDFNVTFFD